MCQCRGVQEGTAGLTESTLKMHLLECVDKFWYMGDMIYAGGGVEAGSIARIRSGWKRQTQGKGTKQRCCI